MGYELGLHEVGDDCWAYLQPDGGWGWSNAGLIRSGSTSMLVDTLFDLKLTGDMLDAMAPITSAAPIGTLVNTHANGDHCYGNELVTGADIVASTACAREMEAVPPSVLAGMMAAAPEMGALGDYLLHCFSSFDFDGITLTPPTTTFDGTLSLMVGDKPVELIEVGPAHTAGDVIVHSPDDGTVFTGDILFIEGTPLMWAGPIGNWIAACDRIIDLDAEVIVPGHGPLTDADGVRRMRSYLEFVEREATARFEAGMTAADAAADIQLGEFAEWIDRERIAINVDSVYRELDPDRETTDIVTLFTMMSQLAV